MHFVSKVQGELTKSISMSRVHKVLAARAPNLCFLELSKIVPPKWAYRPDRHCRCLCDIFDHNEDAKSPAQVTEC